MNFISGSRLKHTAMDFLRFLYYNLNNERHKSNMRRYKSCTNKKATITIKKEMSALRKHWGCIPMHYFTHDFYRDDCILDIADMKKYIPGYFFYKVIYPLYDALPRNGTLLDDKIVSHYIFKGMDLPTPTVLCIKKNDNLYDLEGNSINSCIFSEKVLSALPKKIFVKPVGGRGGSGIVIIDDYAGSLDEKFEFIKSLTGDYVIECQVVQTNYLSTIYPHSVNTLRAITIRERSGVVSLVAVTLRMGVDGSQVDNSAKGGILIGLDLETGRPFRSFASHEYGAVQFHQHPDTGFDFSQLSISDWPAIKSKIIDFAKQMTLYNLVGWDIAITDSGPLVIEANTGFGIDHTQSGVGGMKDFFLPETGLPVKLLNN